jgi:hypothetical protein
VVPVTLFIGACSTIWGFDNLAVGDAGSGGDSGDGDARSMVTDASQDVRDASTAAEAGSTCVTDLSGVGTGDFRVSFTLTTTETGLTVGLVNQRAGCDQTSVWWDATLTPSGGIELATDDGSSTSYVFVESGNAVNDGAPHKIVVARTNGAIWYSRDGVLGSSMTPDPYAFGNFPALRIGSDPCPNTVGLAGNGSLTDLCITAMTAAPTVDASIDGCVTTPNEWCALNGGTFVQCGAGNWWCGSSPSPQSSWTACQLSPCSMGTGCSVETGYGADGAIYAAGTVTECAP